MPHRPNHETSQYREPERSVTPGALPVLTENTRVRTNIKTVVAVLVALAGAVVWCTCTWIDIQSLKEAVRATTAQQDRMAGDISALRDEVRRLTWILEQPATARAGFGRSGTP